MAPEHDDSILFIDDEPLTLETFTDRLRRLGFRVEPVSCAETAYEWASTKRFSLILLDLMLGKQHGTTLIHQLRALGIATPIVVFSVHDSEYYQLAALKSGADDYIVKTMELSLLHARLCAHIAREKRHDGHKPAAQRRIPLGRCVLDRQAHVLEDGDNILKLTERETKLIDLLASDPNRVFSVRVILERIRGREYLMSPEALHAMVGRLRKKLKDTLGVETLIENQHGNGFKIVLGALSHAR